MALGARGNNCMKDCKNCNEFMCGFSHTDHVSEYCGRETNKPTEGSVKKDSTQYKTGAVRDTGGKGRMDLLPWYALIRVSKHMEDALTHYPERNWEKGLPMHTMIDSAFRHLAKYVDGWTDEDHLCAAATNLLMAMWTEEHNPPMQDIPSRIRRYEGASPAKEKASPLCSDSGYVQHAVPTSHVQEKPKKTFSDACECYEAFHCLGTKERDECSCGGDTRKCDFFEEIRNGKQKQKT